MFLLSDIDSLMYNKYQSCIMMEKERIKKKKKECLHAGSNYGPPVYKTGALPLSYRGSLTSIADHY